METSVLDWLEKAAEEQGDRIAYASPDNVLSFSNTEMIAKRIGTGILRRAKGTHPAAILMERDVMEIAAFFGVVFSGRAYAPIDPGFPENRIRHILETLQPSVIVTDEKNRAKVIRCLPVNRTDIPVASLEELTKAEPDPAVLNRIRRQMTEADPLYIIFTSGSTGTPKGVTTSHRALMSYIEAYAEMMEIRREDKLGCQSPLDYIAAIRDIYLPVLRGSSTFLIPHALFMQTKKLAEILREQQITTLGWSTSALTILTSLGFLKTELPDTLQKICFSGSVMPGSVLRQWQEKLPGTRFVNQYGPTEATASCTFYRVDHLVEPGEEIPIGVPYANYRIQLMLENGTEAASGEQGEICVAGPCLALGYYGDPERTRQDFIQNPLHQLYDERIYRTGDIGSLRADGNLMFHGRKDRMIKHMGHRIELDEVENAAMSLEGIRECAALYQAEKETLWLFYAGEADSREIATGLRKNLPGFMIPRKMKQLGALPRLANGKMNMTELKKML